MKVLVVDDEPIFLQTMFRALSLNQHEMIVAQDGRMAMEILTGEDGPSIHMVITDLDMPKMSGVELVRNIRKTSPDIPIIIVTGFADANTMKAIEEYSLPLLQKPFSYFDLVKLLKSMMDQHQGDGTHAIVFNGQ